MPLPLALIGGAANVVGSLIGSRKRKREAKAAAAEFETQRNALMDTQFTNPYANLENTAEDLTVNTQAANFQTQQTDAALAQGLDAIIAGGGGGGGAQAIAAAALQSKQGISNTIAQQEQQNEMLRVQQAAKLQDLEAQGEEDLQVANYEKQQDLLKLASARKQQSDLAQSQATKQMFGGIGQMAGGLGDVGFGTAGKGAETVGADGTVTKGPTKVGGFLQNLFG